MIRKGVDFDATFSLKESGGAPAVEGKPAASFGYRLGADDGVWAEWTWKDGRFELRNDRLGFYPIYYRRDAAGFGASNSVERLLRAGAPAKLDDAALAVFLRLGFYLGDDTPFASVRALPPGAVLSRDAAGLRVEAAAPWCAAESRVLSRDAAVGAFGEVFQSAVGKFPLGSEEKIAVPLSGGRDSRHILFALLAAGRRPDACLTVRRVPPIADEDALVAAEVARFDGLNHAVLPRATDLLGDELEKNRRTGFCADEHVWILPLSRHLRENAFTAAFDGIGGDVLSASLYLNEKRLRHYERGELRDLAEDILEPEGYLPHLLRPDLYRRWSREAAVARVLTELEKYRGRPNPVGQFYFWNRTRREIALSPWNLLNGPGYVFAPYLSAEVYDFLSALPASYYLGRTFHTETIARRYPERAHLPYETKSAPPARLDRAAIARYARDASRYCLLPEKGRRQVRASFCLPRVAKGLLDAEYGTSLHVLFNKAVYLAQLESLL